MTEGEIVLVNIQQADGQRKNRPAVYLREIRPYGDLLVCGISTQLRQEVPEFDEIIGPTESDFDQSGLSAPSLIRLGYLATVPANHVLGTIGSIASERHERLLRSLSEYLVE